MRRRLVLRRAFLRFLTPARSTAYREEALGEELALTGSRFHQAFDAAPVGVALVSMQGRILDSNEALQLMLDYTRAELLGRSVTDLTHPDDYAAARSLYWQLLAGQRDSYRIQKRYFRKDGSTTRALLTVSLLRDLGGQPRYLLGLLVSLDPYAQALHLRHVSLAPQEQRPTLKPDT